MLAKTVKQPPSLNPSPVFGGGRMPGRITLTPGRDRPVRRRHPWIFSRAIARVDDAQDGDLVDVVSASGELLARGFLNRKSQITVRLLSWDASETIDAAFWRARVERAAALRATGPACCRLVHAESDGVPGFVADRYGPWVVVQVNALGVERVRDALVGALAALPGVRGVYERSDEEMRTREGLATTEGVVAGEAPPDTFEVEEPSALGSTLRFAVDLRGGHKTGFYLDQRDNRRRVAAWCKDADVLDAFAYSGAFGVHALSAGARSLVAVDSSADALVLARRNLDLNALGTRAELVEEDAFAALRRFRAEGRRFDAIVLDPPKLAKTAGHVDRASRAYKDANLVAMQLLRHGGVLATFSCSGAVTADLFQKIVFGACVDARREVQILERLGQPPDHPVLLSFPEGEYLKGLVCRVL